MAYQSLQDLAKNLNLPKISTTTNTSTPQTMGVQAVYPGATNTVKNTTLTPKDTLKAPTPLNLTSAMSSGGLKPTTGTTVGQHVGQVSNNPAFGPVGQVITREGLQKIASGQDPNQPGPREAYARAYAERLGSSLNLEDGRKEYDRLIANKLPIQLPTPVTSQTQPITQSTNTFGGTAVLPTQYDATGKPTGFVYGQNIQTPTNTVQTASTGNFGANTGTSTATVTPPATTPTTPTTPETPKVGNEQWQGYLKSLTDLKNKYQPALEQKQKEIADLATKQSQQIGGVLQTSGDASLQMGKGGILQTLAAQQQAIKQKELDQLMNSYQQEASILGTQIGATQPSAGTAYFGSPTSGGLIGGGSLFQAGTLAGQQAMGQQYPAMKASVDQASTIKSSIQNLLASTPINPTMFTDVNSAINFLTGKVGSPQMQTLGNYIGQYIATLAPILGTNTNAIAQDMVNAQAQGGSISDVLNNLQNMANAKLQVYQNVGAGTNTPVNIQSTFNTPNILGGALAPKISYDPKGNIIGMSF